LGAVQAALHAAGAVSAIVAPRLGVVETSDGDALEAAASFENAPPVLFDAVLMPDGEVGASSLLRQAQAVDLVAHQYRHGKTLLAPGASKALLDRAGVDISGEADHAAFITAIGKHRHPARETDPPRV
jgi:catalase